MDRRTFLKTAGGAGAFAAAGGLATPAISQRAAARAVRMVPHADVANFDPVWTTAYIARNAGLLVFDMLYAALDWGTVVARRAQKSPAAQGGWQIFHTYFAGVDLVDLVDPTSRIIRANGDKAFFGWPNVPEIEAGVAAWFDARTPDEEKAIARKLNRLAFDHAIYAPLGQFLQLQAWRTSLAGVGQGPLPFFWGVSKTA